VDNAGEIKKRLSPNIADDTKEIASSFWLRALAPALVASSRWRGRGRRCFSGTRGGSRLPTSLGSFPVLWRTFMAAWMPSFAPGREPIVSEGKMRSYGSGGSCRRPLKSPVRRSGGLPGPTTGGIFDRTPRHRVQSSPGGSHSHRIQLVLGRPPPAPTWGGFVFPSEATSNNRKAQVGVPCCRPRMS
jgi:hypothetical protein